MPSHTSTCGFAQSVLFSTEGPSGYITAQIWQTATFAARMTQTYLLLRHGFRRLAGLHLLASANIGPLHLLHGKVSLVSMRRHDAQ